MIFLFYMLILFCQIENNIKSDLINYYLNCENGKFIFDINKILNESRKNCKV